MEYNFTGKGISITTPMQDAAIATLSSLDRYLNDNDLITTTVEKEGHKIKVTIRFNYANENVKISEVGEDYYYALDSLADIIKNKMERLHERNVSRKHLQQKEPIFVEKDENEIVRRKFIVPGQMTEDEAILKMNELGHQSFLFDNSDMGGATCLIYKRKTGNYGILQTNK